MVVEWWNMVKKIVLEKVDKIEKFDKGSIFGDKGVGDKMLVENEE